MSIKNDPPMDTEISDLYQSTQDDGPSPALDAAVLAQAEAAVTPKRKRPAWIAPVGLAATVLLGVNLAVNLKDYSNAPEVYSETGQSVALPSSLPELRIPSESMATSDDAANDTLSNPPNPAFDAYALRKITKEQNEEMNLSGDSPAPSQVMAATDIDDDQMLLQDRQGSRARTPEESQRRIERFIAARAAEERIKKAEGYIDHAIRHDLPQQPEPQVRSDNTNRVVAQNAPPVSPKRDIPVSVAASPPTEPRLRTQPSRMAMPELAPQISTSTLPDTAAPAAAPAPIARDLSESEDTDIQEVVVTGTKAPQFNTSPHARLTAKEQVKRNEVQQGLYPDTSESSTAVAGVATKPVSESPGIYLCDLEALKIDVDTVESAKVDARNLEPPLNALTWPGYIRDRAEENNYIEACAHLAAYQLLYPDIAMIELLPLTILKQK